VKYPQSLTVRGANGGAITLMQDSGDSYGGFQTHLSVLVVSDALAPTAVWLSLDYDAAKMLISALADFTVDHPYAPETKGKR
jgi:hypothetical protein